MNVPLKMRKPRNIRTEDTDTEAWFYIENNVLDIHTSTKCDEFYVHACCRLTRRQLESALAVMDEYAAN